VTDVEFSVVIPVHNKERHVARSVLSALSQSHPANEIIAIDDASKDGSMAEIVKIGVPIVTLRRDEPGPGGYAARNLGIESAKSEWIAFLDADDSWAPDHLEGLAAAIRRADGKAVSAFSGYDIVTETLNLKDWFTRAGYPAGCFDARDMLDKWLAGGCPFWTGAVAIRRQTLLDIGMFPVGRVRRGGDRDLWLRTVLAGSSAYSGKPTAVYHKDSDNMVTRQVKFDFRVGLMSTIDERLKTEPPEIAERLQQIANREIYQYVLKAWKDGDRINDDMVRGLTIGGGLGYYARVQAMRRLPMPFSQDFRRRIMERRDLKRQQYAARKVAHPAPAAND
jgi:succinoglycan biosynthesis protein ExoO